MISFSGLFFIFIDLPYFSLWYLAFIIKTASNMKRTLNMYFATHKTCNLNCRYCYVPQYNRASKKVSDEGILDAFHAFLQKVVNENYQIGSFCLHGSEPSLMRPATLGRIALEMKDHWRHNDKKEHRIAIQSNGYRLNEEYMNELIRYIDSPEDVKLGFSIDPPKQVHDLLRNDSYDIVYRNYENAMDMSFPVSVLSVVSKHTMDHLEGFADWMKLQLERKKRSGNPYKVKIKFATGEASLNEDQMPDFAHFLSDNDLLGLVQMLTPGYCIQNGNECYWYEFDIEGNCYSCNKTYYDEGVFANWKKENFDIIYKKRKNLYIDEYENPECEECSYQFICMSGCPVDRHKNGNMAGKAHECTLIKTAYAEIEKKGIHIADFYNNNI